MHRNMNRQILKRKVYWFSSSLGFTIPKQWAFLHDIKPGDALDVEVLQDRLIISIPEEVENDVP